MAPNNNNWYGTGIAAATNYLVANDGQVTLTDLTVPGLAKPNSTRSLTLGGTGHTMRLSLNSSTPATPNSTAVNLTDVADPLAGTDATLQATDTAGTGYYSLALRVTDITGLNATGGILAAFNNTINAQVGNPTTGGAGLAIRPKAGGGPNEFELGVVDQATSGFTSATYDTVNAYTTNTTIFVVGKYQTVGVPGNPTPAENDDVATLWINPSPATFGGFDPTTGVVLFNNSTNNDIPTNASTNNHTLQSFILRQTGATVNNQVPPGVIFDELRVGTNYADVTPVVPEPGSTALALVGAAGIAAVRRRRR
jgi:MYXO-CTERM domain-containing protein